MGSTSSEDRFHPRSLSTLLVIGVLALTAAALLTLPQPASAGQRCPGVNVSEIPLSVGVGGGIGCNRARNVVIEFYDWYLGQPGSSQSKFLDDFFCRLTIRGHLECNQEPRWIYASVDPGAKPWTWPSPWYEPPPERLKRPPFLSRKMAKRWMRVALSRHFGGNWEYRVNATVKCGKRVNRNSIGCQRIAWAVGDFGFWGKGAIWYRRVGREIEWHYSFRIRRLDEYCAFVRERPRTKCLKLYVIR